MIFEVPSSLRPHIVSMCPNGIVVFCDVPKIYRGDAEALQMKWAEAREEANSGHPEAEHYMNEFIKNNT